MLNDKQIEQLKANWGDKADSLDCYAWVELFDPISNWECYLYALNPEDDEVKCVIRTNFSSPPALETWSLEEIKRLYNQFGEGVQVNEEYRPIKTNVLVEKINRQWRIWKRLM